MIHNKGMVRLTGQLVSWVAKEEDAAWISMLTAQGPNDKALSAKEREDCMLSAACKVVGCQNAHRSTGCGFGPCSCNCL